jgi:hypothetical protein
MVVKHPFKLRFKIKAVREWADEGEVEDLTGLSNTIPGSRPGPRRNASQEIVPQRSVRSGGGPARGAPAEADVKQSESKINQKDAPTDIRV